MKTVFIIMDSLNRHYLNAYGDSRVKTPNLDRLAERSLVFENHYCGSMPCMPARREFMTGRLNFMETPWGPIEPWDDCLPVELRRQKSVHSHMITDHYHYFHSGGEAYHTLFNTWEFERGQEGDVWRPVVEPPKAPSDTRGKSVHRRAYWANRSFLDAEDDLAYPTPRCFRQAIEFLELNKNADDWHLHLEVFDPHEPFDSPQVYRDLYEDEWDGYLFNWPSYDKLDPELDTPDVVTHIRKRYAATLSMADAWLGKFLDKMDQLGMWEDTVVVLGTDHGHFLGERGYWAKNYMMDWNELTRIPLFVSAPGVAPRRVKALTANMDLMPTFMDLHQAESPQHVHGSSLTHLFEKEEDHHDAVLFGYFAKDVNMVDGQHTYCRQPIEGAVTHHHTAMPRHGADFISREILANAETGVFLNTTHGVPHFRIPVASRRHRDSEDFNPIYDLRDDPGQERPVMDAALESELAEKMKDLMIRCDAPPCQFKRLGF